MLLMNMCPYNYSRCFKHWGARDVSYLSESVLGQTSHPSGIRLHNLLQSHNMQ